MVKKKMRLVDVIVMLSLVGVLFTCGAVGFRSSKDLVDKKNKKKLEFESTRFISESFLMACNGNGFDDLNQWQKECRNLWNLDYIGWCKASDFMIDPSPEEGLLFYGKWIGPFGEGEVYGRQKRESEN